MIKKIFLTILCVVILACNDNKNKINLIPASKVEVQNEAIAPENNIEIKDKIWREIKKDEFIDPFVEDVDYDNGHLYLTFNMEVLRASRVGFANGFNEILMVKRFCYVSYTLYHKFSNVHNIILHVNYREGATRYDFKSITMRSDLNSDMNGDISKGNYYSESLKNMKDNEFLKKFYLKYFKK